MEGAKEMSIEKKEPIVFMLPESFKDRKFAVCFEKHLKSMKDMVFLDMDKINFKPRNKIEMRLAAPSLDSKSYRLKMIHEYNPLLNCKY